MYFPISGANTICVIDCAAALSPPALDARSFGTRAIMFATVNKQPQAPSAANRAVPHMLDLIVAKALAKAIDDRYQSATEFANDLREVWRGVVGKPATSALWVTQKLNTLGATGTQKTLAEREVVTAPPGKIGPPGDSTIQTGGATQFVRPDGRYNKAEAPPEGEVKALSLARQFDNFDATMKLAAKTAQTDEFRDYITATQKMQAFKNQKTVERLQEKLTKSQRMATLGSDTGTNNMAAFKAHGGAAKREESNAFTLIAWLGVAVLLLVAVVLAIALFR